MSSRVNLVWKTNHRDGRAHQEYSAECGCAFHYFDGDTGAVSPHWHPCNRHLEGANWPDERPDDDRDRIEDEAQP